MKNFVNKFFLCVNDCIEDMVTFTILLVKAKCFCTTKVAGLGFSPAQICSNTVQCTYEARKLDTFATHTIHVHLEIFVYGTFSC